MSSPQRVLDGRRARTTRPARPGRARRPSPRRRSAPGRRAGRPPSGARAAGAAAAPPSAAARSAAPRRPPGRRAPTRRAAGTAPGRSASRSLRCSPGAPCCELLRLARLERQHDHRQPPGELVAVVPAQPLADRLGRERERARRVGEQLDLHVHDGQGLASRMAYVHGYHERESERLDDQAGALVELLHHDTAYPAGARVLEAGCGIGSQTVTLVANSPEARVHVDRRVGESQLEQARDARAGRRLPAGGHLRAAVRGRSRSTTSSCASCSSTSPRPLEALRSADARAAPGRHDHRDRGRPRLGVLPPRQRRGPRGDRLPRQAPARRREHRPRALPAAGRGRPARRQRLAADGLRRRAAAPASSRASPAGRSPR